MRNWFLGASLVLMVACSAGENTGSIPKDSIRIQTSTLNSAVVNEPYNASVTVLGGVVPYVFRVADGKLPQGMSFNNGSLSGTPTEKGSFSFTVEVTDGNLSSKIQRLTLNVIDKPPPELSLELPGTPIKSLTRVPVLLKNADNVAAGRMVLTLPDGLTVKGVQGNKGKPLVFWNVKDSKLTVDFAFSQKFFRENRALFLELESSKENGVTVPTVTSANYDLRDASGKKLAATDLLTPPAPKPEETKTDGKTPDGGKPAGDTPKEGTPTGTDDKNPDGEKPAGEAPKEGTPTGTDQETPAAEEQDPNATPDEDGEPTEGEEQDPAVPPTEEGQPGAPAEGDPAAPPAEGSSQQLPAQPGQPDPANPTPEPPQP